MIINSGVYVFNINGYKAIDLATSAVIHRYDLSVFGYKQPLTLSTDVKFFNPD